MSHKRKAFTLIELLVVVGILALLTSILLPSLSAAMEQAKVVRVKADLYGISTALIVYGMDHDGCYPPVRTSCNEDMRGHEYQLPVELSQAGYLPQGPDLNRMVGMEDVFNPDHTYKYNAPGDLINNNTLITNGNYVWVPDSFPGKEDVDGDLWTTDDGKLYNKPETSPLAWVLWSKGPKPGSEKTQSPRAPASKRTWYYQTGDSGLICRILTSDEQIITSP